jgi:hypothetical protein
MGQDLTPGIGIRPEHILQQVSSDGPKEEVLLLHAAARNEFHQQENDAP